MKRALLALVLVACGRPEPATTSATAPVEVPTTTCPTDCDPGPTPSCPSGSCNELGSCSCSPETGATDCPATGCCAAAVDADGQPLLGADGYAVHQCVTPACTSDADCADGAICEGTCGEARCVCPAGEGPDPEHPCCVVTDQDGVCCESGAVDADGYCVCPDGMTDRGDGCACPDGMIVDDDGACVCGDPNATRDPDAGACVCAPGFVLDSDPYTGESSCVDHPIGCPDPDEVIDPDTGQCVCGPGLILGEADDTATPQCVPASCGDGVCSDGETCSSCEADCGPCDPEYGLPDAGTVDAPPATDAGLDAGAGPLDAGCVITEGFAVVCHEQRPQ